MRFLKRNKVPDPTDNTIEKAKAHHEHGLACSARGNYDEAIRELQEAIRQNPKFVEAHNDLGVVFRKRGDLNNSIHELEESIKLNPDYALAHCNLGTAYFDKYKLDDAIKEFNTSIRLDPYCTIAYYNLGNSFAKKNQISEAITAYEKFISQVNSDTARNLGDVPHEVKIAENFIRQFKSSLTDDQKEVYPQQNTLTSWEKGFKILDSYNILDIKKGGMGIVYIAYAPLMDQSVAIKTFQDKYLWNSEVVSRFLKEAEIWVELGRHSNVVFAETVLEIEGKPMLFLEYIDCGDLNQFIGIASLEEILDIGIQFCTGMWYAYQKLGVIHRDIKPGNVMVQKDTRFKYGFSFKVTDFGLVKAVDIQPEFNMSCEVKEIMGDAALTQFGASFGTPEYMSPEQFIDARNVDTRSDIYSAGVMLYQLLTGELPFQVPPKPYSERFERYKESHLGSKPIDPIRKNPKLPQSLNMLVMKCLEKSPQNRYKDFNDLREDLLKIYQDITGERYTIVGREENLKPYDWVNKGAAFRFLGKHQNAIECYDKALSINPHYYMAWFGKGVAFNKLGKNKESLECIDKALDINSRDDGSWNSKGVALLELGRPDEALGCFDKALKINPRNEIAWRNKGNALDSLKRPHEALTCYDSALRIDQRSPQAWFDKGLTFKNVGDLQKALECIDNALKINPRYAKAWQLKGSILSDLGNPQETIICFDTAIEINPRLWGVWNNKGVVLDNLGRTLDAIECYDNSLIFNPGDVGALYNKGAAYIGLGKYQEALVCLEEFLKRAPLHPSVEQAKQMITYLKDQLSHTLHDFDAGAGRKSGNYQEGAASNKNNHEVTAESALEWTKKGNDFGNLGKVNDAIECFNKALDIDPTLAEAWNGKGAAFGILGKFQDAITCFDKAISLNSKYLEARNNKGIALGELGKYQESVECFNKILEINPRYELAWKNREIALNKAKKMR
jgi:tetratricopeptide (TPR) repeat protein